MDFEALVRDMSVGGSFAEKLKRFIEASTQTPDAPVAAIQALAAASEQQPGLHRFGAAVLDELIAHERWDDVVNICSETTTADYLRRHLVWTIGQLESDLVDTLLGKLDANDLFAIRLGSEINQESLMRTHSSGVNGLAMHREAQLAGLPIGWLPSKLHHFENDHRRYLKFRGNQQIPLPELTPTAAPKEPPATLQTLLESRSLFPSSQHMASSAIYSAHQPALLQSNGDIEVATFGSWPNDKWTRPGLDFEAPVTHLEPFKVTQRLFVMSPGAYAKDRSSWEARLAMGQTLEAFMGADPNASFFDVMNRIPDYEWFGFDPASDWAHNTFWDLGLLCLLDGRAIALVATDSD